MSIHCQTETRDTTDRYNVENFFMCEDLFERITDPYGAVIYMYLLEIGIT